MGVLIALLPGMLSVVFWDCKDIVGPAQYDSNLIFALLGGAAAWLCWPAAYPFWFLGTPMGFTASPDCLSPDQPDA